jgi:hypothetical protein
MLFVCTCEMLSQISKYDYASLRFLPNKYSNRHMLLPVGHQHPNDFKCPSIIGRTISNFKLAVDKIRGFPLILFPVMATESAIEQLSHSKFAGVRCVITRDRFQFAAKLRPG